MAIVYYLCSEKGQMVLQWCRQILKYSFVSHSIVCAIVLVFLLAFSAVAQDQSRDSTVQQCAETIEKTIGEYLRAGDYASALPVIERLEQVSKAQFGEASRCHARAMAHKATVLQLLNRLSEAEPLFENSLQIYRRHLPADHAEVTLALNNLGSHRFWMRRYAEAARLHEEALDARRKRLPLDEKAVAESLHNLADAYRYLGRTPSAVIQLYRESLAIRVRVLGAADPAVGQSQQNLASALELMGDLRGAAVNLADALAIYLKVRPDTDPRIASVMNRQGNRLNAITRRRAGYRRDNPGSRLPSCGGA